MPVQRVPSEITDFSYLSPLSDIIKALLCQSREVVLLVLLWA